MQEELQRQVEIRMQEDLLRRQHEELLRRRHHEVSLSFDVFPVRLLNEDRPPAALIRTLGQHQC